MSNKLEKPLPGSKTTGTDVDAGQPSDQAGFSTAVSADVDLASDFRVDAANPEAIARTSRLKDAVRLAGGNKLVASRAGVPVSTLGAYLAGRDWRIGTAVALAQACNVSLDWLATGRDTTQLPVQASASAQVEGKYVAIPRFDVRAAAGPGIPVDQEELLGLVSFDEHFLRRQLGLQLDHLVTLEATGDSMYPTIRDGDLLLVDTGNNEIQDGRIYVLSLDGLLSVKRLQVQFGGNIALISDNDRYPTQVIAPSERNPLRIIGRVVYQAGPVRS